MSYAWSSAHRDTQPGHFMCAQSQGTQDNTRAPERWSWGQRHLDPEAKRSCGDQQPNRYLPVPKMALGSPSLCHPQGRGISAHLSLSPLQPFPTSCQCCSPLSRIQHPCRTLPGKVEAVESPPQSCGERGQGKRCPNLLPARWGRRVGSSRSCR